MTCFHCPTSRVVDPPRVIYNDVYHPQIVQVIHPIEVINRHHCVPIPCHTFTVAVRDEFCPTPSLAQIRSVKKKKSR